MRRPPRVRTLGSGRVAARSPLRLGGHDGRRWSRCQATTALSPSVSRPSGATVGHWVESRTTTDSEGWGVEHPGRERTVTNPTARSHLLSWGASSVFTNPPSPSGDHIEYRHMGGGSTMAPRGLRVRGGGTGWVADLTSRCQTAGYDWSLCPTTARNRRPSAPP